MDPRKKILDVTCGCRSIWFNKNHPAAIYAVSQYPNVLWTHQADMLASHVAGV